MKNALLTAVIMSSVLLVGCDRTDEISDQSSSSTGIGYSQKNEQPTQNVPNTPENAEKSTETLRQKTDKALDSMDDAVQKMSEEFSDTVDNIKKGAKETADDVKKSINDMRNQSSTDSTVRVQPKENVEKKLQDIRNDLSNERSLRTDPNATPAQDPSSGNTATDLTP